MRCFFIYKRRCYILFTGFILCFICIYSRIIKLQYTDSAKLRVLADSQYKYTEKIRELNYKLLDCNGKDMMKYNSKYKAVIIPSMFGKNDMKKEQAPLKILSILNDYNKKYDILDKKYLSSNQKLIFDIDYDTYKKLRSIDKVKGFYTFEYSNVDRSEAWSIENMITSTRNLNTGQNKDKASLEVIIKNKLKDNKDYRRDFKIDMNGNIKEFDVNDYIHNKNIRLTLDKTLQQDIRNMLNEKYDKYEQIGVILMESDTGKIRAMVQKNDKLPNVNIGAETLNGFFPGSIFKTMVLEAALESKDFNEHKNFQCKSLYEGNKKIKSHGKLNMEEAFVVSCNDIYSQIGKEVGFESIYELSKKQGLFDKVLGLDREQQGSLQEKEPKWEDGSLGLFSIGQNIRITPLEALSIVNTVINKGKYVKPYIIDAYIDKDNNEIESMCTTKYEVISECNADKVKNAMEKVVDLGTGRMSKIDGVEMGGKTGSTERVEIIKNKTGKYENMKLSDGWFIGFLKKGDKYYSTVVFVKNIDKNYEGGGNTAAPIFRDVINIASF